LNDYHESVTYSYGGESLHACIYSYIAYISRLRTNMTFLDYLSRGSTIPHFLEIWLLPGMNRIIYSRVPFVVEPC